MDLQRARKILETLADGVDPMTGEVLPEEHVCNRGMLCGHSITFCRNFLISPKRNRQRMRENHGQRRMMRCFAGCMTRAAAKKNFVLTLSARRGESRRVWYGWGKLQRVMSLKNRRDQVPPPEFNQRRYFLIVFNLLLQQTEIPLEAICCIE